MALPNITFNRGQAGLGRTLASEDHISGLLTFNASLPTGYGATDRIKEYTDLSQAEADGITEGNATWGVLWYFIKEFFRIQPGGKLFNMIADVPVGAYDFVEVVTLQDFADGKLRQVGVFVDSEVFATSHITALQVQAAALAGNHKPLQILYAGDTSAVADITTLPDLRTLNSPNVSVVIGQDGANDGADLFTSTSKSVPCLGAFLGAVAFASVSDSVAWVSKFNMANLTEELDVPAFGNGDLVKNTLTSVLEGIDTKGYIFLLKHIGIDGTYFSQSHSAITATSDYATIENNRTIDKAIRGIRTSLLPTLSGPLKLKSDGTLSVSTVKYFESLASRPLEGMARNDELSDFDVSIDPSQNVLSTSNLVIDVQLIPIGVANFITVNIGFTVSIA